MSTPATPVTQAVIDQAAQVLGQVSAGLEAVAAALPALLSASPPAVDATALIAAVSKVVTDANAVTALLPPPAAPGA